MMAPINLVLPMPVAIEKASDGKSRSKLLAAGTIALTLASSAAINISSIPASVGGFCNDNASVTAAVSSNAFTSGFRSESL